MVNKKKERYGKVKKTLAVILVIVLVLGMAGCGGSTKEPEPTATPEPAAEPTPEPVPEESAPAEPEEDPTIIEFTDVVLVENDTVRLELVNFYLREYNSVDKDNVVGSCITVKATNKSDHGILLNQRPCYLNGEEVVLIGVSGGSLAPDAGRSGMLHCGCTRRCVDMGKQELWTRRNYDTLTTVQRDIPSIHSGQ